LVIIKRQLVYFITEAKKVVAVAVAVAVVVDGATPHTSNQSIRYLFPGKLTRKEVTSTGPLASYTRLST